MLPQIQYLFLVQSLADVSPFQGFASELISMMDLLELPPLPADIIELTLEPTIRFARRRAGLGGWMWLPIEYGNLIGDDEGPSPNAPFMVVFSEKKKVADEISKWLRRLEIQPLHVSLAPIKGVVHPSQFTIDRLQQHCERALKQAKRVDQRLEINSALALIRAWKSSVPTKPSSLRLHSHGVTKANEIVLISVGERAPTNLEGCLGNSLYERYVEGITESVNAVLKVQSETDDQSIFMFCPPRPDIILFAPSAFRGIFAKIAKQRVTPAVMAGINALERQKSYRFELEGRDAVNVFRQPPEEVFKYLALLTERGVEFKLQTYALGLRAASTLSATIRLPANIGRTAGIIGQFAGHIRCYEDKILPARKTARVFRNVQKKLLECIPPEHIELLMRSRTGVKIVSDAPLEWLPIHGLPLGIRMDVSRVNTTPGNMMLQQIGTVPPLYIPVKDFRKFLLLSMFDDNDNLANHVPAALKALSIFDEVQGERLTPNSAEQFTEAINKYDGPLLIVDSHGIHNDDELDVGGLIIGGHSINVWELAGKIKVPPVVILSACDTHPFDRSYATVANGFLYCGAVCVLSTALPIRSQHAALFLARVLFRIFRFADNRNKHGISVSWTNIIGGALRMHLAFDIATELMQRNLLSNEQAQEVCRRANIDIDEPREDWFEALGQRCRNKANITEIQWLSVFDDVLAGSDVIRYVNLGNPESIILCDVDAVQKALNSENLSAESQIQFE